MADSNYRGVFDPWSEDKLCDPNEHWDLHRDGCPLLYASKLLLNWPDSTPTVDMDEEGKIERLVGIILGYPKISRGMYPLDWPTHPESVKALRLSLLFDSISCDYYPEWSLRMSISNIHQIYCLDGKLRKPDICKLITSMLFKSVRNYKTSVSEIDADSNVQLDKSKFTREEVILLTRLHSSSNNSSGYWQEPFEEYRIKNKNGAEYKLDNIKSIIKDVATNYEHDFRVVKIQNWIRKMTSLDYEGDYPIGDSIRQNMVSGCSVIIESVFATLRNTVVTKFGASSILVDGGGRIRFYAKDVPDLEEYIKSTIYETFKFHKDFAHPFNNIIIESVRAYQEKYPEKYETAKYINKKTGKTSTDLFDELIGKKVTEKLLPPISYNYDNNLELSKDPFDSNCLLCNPENWNSETKWKSYSEKRSGWGNHCFPHKLIFDIGRSAKKRDISWRKAGRYKLLNSDQMFKIESVGVMDLNSLGIMFNSSNSTFENLMHMVRKSFAFNSKWWKIISEVLDHHELNFGSLTAWVAAGDDLTLALRKGNEEYDLIRVFEMIDERLKLEFKHNNIAFSFGAGIANRRNREPILSLIKKAQSAEKKAKMQWKFRASIHDEKLVTVTNYETNETELKDGIEEVIGSIIINDTHYFNINHAHKSVVYCHEVEEE